MKNRSPGTPATSPADTSPLVPVTLWEITRYFLYLGTLGFGGPLALIQAMDEDLVQKRRWLSEQEYLEGLAIANTLPGPVAYQPGITDGHHFRGCWIDSCTEQPSL